MLSMSLKNISRSVNEYFEKVSASLDRLSNRCSLGVFFGFLFSSLSLKSSSSLFSSLDVSSYVAVLENLFAASFSLKLFSFSSFS
jgi:hypothetical protein